jgi:hypothetical protein
VPKEPLYCENPECGRRLPDRPPSTPGRPPKYCQTKNGRRSESCSNIAKRRRAAPRVRGHIDLVEGDAVKVLATLPDRSVKLFIFDPPYPCKSAEGKYGIPMSLAAYFALAHEVTEVAADKLCDDGAFIFYVNVEETAEPWLDASARFGLRVARAQPFLWLKTLPDGKTLIPSRAMTRHDELIYVLQKGRGPLWFDKDPGLSRDRRLRAPLRGARDGGFSMKPPEIAKRLILATTESGDLVVDLFTGSGSTGLALQEINRLGPDRARRGLMIDISTGRAADMLDLRPVVFGGPRWRRR